MKPATALLALCLAACASPQDRASQHAQRDEAYTRHLSSQCEALGYALMTEGWKQCMLQLHQQAQSHQSQMQGIILNNQLQNLPRCGSLPPGLAGYRQAQGTCRP